MDRHAMEAMRSHYDSHSGVEKDQAAEVRKREKGIAAPLKRFHNDVKRSLITKFASNCPRLLDIACGRGGDIGKWNDAGVHEVLGLDLSPGEIEEAKRRMSDFVKNTGSGMRVTFRQTDSVGRDELEGVDKCGYGVVTCMFAAHYFCASEASFHRFVRSVSEALSEGGYFIGTLPEGKGVLRLLNQKMEYVRNSLKLKARWGEQDKHGRHPPPKPFGSGFTFDIADTVTTGGEGSYEYLVFFNAFIAVCEQYSLFPVTRYDWSDDKKVDFDGRHLMTLFDPRDADAPFKHFNPTYKMGTPPELGEASKINVAFVFQKRSPPIQKEVKGPPPSKSAVNAESDSKKRRREDSANANE